MKPEDYAVDNASNTDDPYDTHPCGPGPVLHHSFLDGECQDCGYCCEHENVDEDGGTCECGVYVEAVEEEPYDDSDDRYEAWKADIIESGGKWPPWRD